MAAVKWLPSNGCRQMAAVKWLPSNGCRQMAAVKWLPSNGCRQMAAVKWLPAAVKWLPSNGCRQMADYCQMSFLWGCRQMAAVKRLKRLTIINTSLVWWRICVLKVVFFIFAVKRLSVTYDYLLQHPLYYNELYNVCTKYSCYRCCCNGPIVLQVQIKEKTRRRCQMNKIEWISCNQLSFWPRRAQKSVGRKQIKKPNATGFGWVGQL